jgi:hypothetical protein
MAITTTTTTFLTTTLTDGGYLMAGDVIVREGDAPLTVARWESYNGEVAVFTSYGERYLFGRYERLTIAGHHPARAV